MFLNYLKVFLRLFSKNRTFTGINLLGLSAGFVCFMLIRLYVINEMAYDRHIPEAENTYRLAMKGDMSGFSFESAVMGGPLGRAVREDVPEVILSTTFYKLPRPVLLSRKTHKFYEESIIYADSLFLDFFGYTTVAGDPGKMLSSPYSMVLTRSGARKYFGEDNPTGKVITWNNRRDYTVTGVIEDPVMNSHLNFDILASYPSLMEQEVYRDLLTTFFAFVTYNYIKLDRKTSRAIVEEKIVNVVEKHMGEGMKESGSHFQIFLQPVTEIHLNSSLVHELEPNGSRSSVLIFSAVSILILLIACVNFINLTTARSAGRVKEIGIRIAAGASRRSLFHQFVAESVLFALIGALLAGLFVELIIHDFSDFSGIRIQALPHSSALLFPALIVLGSGIGLLSGLYPALYMSRLYPGWMCKLAARRRPVSKIPRNILVVFQLCITLFLVFNTLVIYRQLLLVNQYDTRINKEDLLIIQMRSPLMYDKYEVLKDELLSVGGVLDITASSGFLGNFQQRRGFYVEGYDRNDLWMLHHIAVACNYLDVMGTDLILGRDFRDHGDSNAVIINQALMRQAGWKNPLGRTITMPDGESEYDFTVIGVVDDFHYASIHDPVESLLIFNNSGGVRYLAVRISAKGNVLRSVEEKWAGLYPDYPFDYFYQEDYLNDQYKEDQKMGSLFIYFTLLAIIISVLGLFGLVLFTSGRRTREIGIRKALGVDTSNLVFYLLKEYPVLLLISASISLPVAWYFAKRWLENFAVQTSIGSLIFIISVILVAAVCLGTILYQTLRTARANPADALRYE